MIMPPKKKKDQPLALRNSDAKKLLEADLKNERISLDHDMDPKDVYLQQQEFSEFEHDRFQGLRRYL
jgi:hypothetical protein